MKSLFEEYGFVMIAAIVVVALLVVGTGLTSVFDQDVNNVMSGISQKVQDNIDLP